MSIDETALLLSGQMAHNENGTFYFDQPGNWVDESGCPNCIRLHRTDGPAIVWAAGTQEWWVDGQLHREDGPAIIRKSGTKLWYLNGQRHCSDGPAIIWADGTQEWWVNGKFVK